MSPKRDIRMDAAEIDGFLAVHDRAVLLAVGADGTTTGGVGRLTRGREGLGFVLGADDPVVDLLRRDDRACCIVEQFPSYYEIQGVLLHGHARERAPGREGEVAFDLAVTRTVSFDFGKLLDESENA